MSYKLITFRAEASEKILREADALHSIRSAWVENINAIVEKGEITRHRINAKITFVLD